tara:strand:+ start:515 stop:670 length:156 start_codon:yes stop_codon:yes gene_type:complete
MSEERYIQKVADKQPKKEKKKEERVLTKPGEYSQADLERAAKIYSPIGGKY